MSEEAQAEAERAVGRLCGWYDEGVPQQDYEMLVAALAAAIEVDAALQAWEWEDNPLTAEERTHAAGRRLHERLAELRAREGTG